MNKPIPDNLMSKILRHIRETDPDKSFWFKLMMMVNFIMLGYNLCGAL